MQLLPMLFAAAGASVATTLESTHTPPSALDCAAGVISDGTAERPKISKIHENKNECKCCVKEHENCAKIFSRTSCQLFFFMADDLLPVAAVATSAVGVNVQENCAGDVDRGPGLESLGAADSNDAHQAKCLPCSLM
jgi:hypothetical protein